MALVIAHLLGLLSTSTLSFAQPPATAQVIVIIGDPKTNGSLNPDGYRNSADLALAATRDRFPSARESVLLGSTKGKFDWSFTGRVLEAANAEQFSKNLRQEISETDPTKSLLLYISDHGSAPTDAKDPLSSAIATADFGNFSHRRLSELISSLGAKRSGGYSRIVSMHCYGGAVHHVAINAPRTCALASAAWSKVATGWKFTPAVFSELKQPAYDLDGDQKPSLLEMFVRGLVEDSSNFPMVQTTSMAFVDQTLGEGAYYKGNARELLFNPELRNSRAPIITQLNNEYITAAEGNGFGCISTVGNVDATPLNVLVGAMGDTLDHLETTNAIHLSSQEESALPAALQTVYRAALQNSRLRDLAKGKDRQRDEKLAALHKEWSEIKPLSAACNADSKSPPECKAIAKQVDDLRSRIAAAADEVFAQQSRSFRGTGNVAPLFLYFKKVAKFMRQANSDEKRILRDLVECETTPL